MTLLQIRQARFIQSQQTDTALVRQELLAGLLAPIAQVSPKYLYDTLGSRLFDAITELDEYYPTRTEAALLAQHWPDMAATLPKHATLVDLGAGNCEKASRLFKWLQPSRYVAVDISTDYLRTALNQLQQQFPALDILGLGMDFSVSLKLPPEAGPEPRILFYPGSSIGNFPPEEAVCFLRQARDNCQGGGLLIGVDLVKSSDILEPAYADALGVTAAFNKNLLLHLNRLLGSDFDVTSWSHIAFFNTALSRIEMHLQATHDVQVHWPGSQRDFRAGERIHTENSYKYTLADFDQCLRSAGFTQTRVWQDAKQWFAMFWASG